MSRYIAEVQVRARLSLGKSVGQFLSREDAMDYAIIKWLTIYKGGDEKEYSLYYNEVIDEGPENFLDLVELTPVDPDDSPVVEEFDSIEEVITFAANTYGALPHKYVTEGMLNDEYADYLRALGIEGK
ncbi:MAG: hypothetical protein EOO57_12840 [Hymenobacter sp.]|nr:MAG: hypothetical protein EOO57_12840 [Hymenobacter sp.]